VQVPDEILKTRDLSQFDIPMWSATIQRTKELARLTIAAVLKGGQL
jgi:hypothetical protein